MIQLTDCIQRQDRLLTSRIDEEEVMLDMDSGHYFGLNSIGTTIWQLITAPITVQDICRQLCAEYDVTADVCQQEVLAFLNHMNESQLIHVRAT